MYVLNQLSTPPEERLEAYLAKCFDNHYDGREEQKLSDLGYHPGQVVVSDEDFSQADLDRILAQLQKGEKEKV